MSLRRRSWKSGKAIAPLVLVAATLLLPPLAGSHPGQAGSISPKGRLEAEAYATANAGCDPAPGGGHTQVIASDDAFGGAYVQMPSGMCTLTFPSMVFPGRARFEHYRGRSPGDADLRFAVAIHIDGVQVASGNHTQSGWHPWEVRQLLNTQPIAKGVHSVQVRATTSIAAQKWLDLVGGQMDDASCVEAVPTTPQIVRSDGFGDGRWGWKSHSYLFEGSPAVEADGDAASTYEFRWGDDTKISNLTTPAASHEYSDAGLQYPTLTVYDNPNGLCPLNSARSDPYVFHTMGDWSSALTRPRPGESCVANVVVSGPPPPQTVVLACTFTARVGTRGAPEDFVEAALFRIDGIVFAVDAEAPYAAHYNATKFPTGPHQADVCFQAKNDKFVRMFCSEPYEFLSALGLPQL